MEKIVVGLVTKCKAYRLLRIFDTNNVLTRDVKQKEIAGFPIVKNLTIKRRDY